MRSNKNDADYNLRSEQEKIIAQWTKLTGLHSREEWSAAVVRSATAAELAANFAIRQEFEARSQFDSEFVNSLLRWANGINGKLDKLLCPILVGQEKSESVKHLAVLARRINKKRNAIAHEGMFCSENEATKLIADCETFIVSLVRLYDVHFELNRGGVSN